MALPLGERVMELCDVAEERGLGEGASNEGVHRLCDTLEREHLHDEQVHDIGFDAGAVLQRSGHLVGEACPGLGVAARTVLDLCVGVTHDLLEHDVDEGAPLAACAGGVGEVFATALARIDGEHPDAIRGCGCWRSAPRCVRDPCPWRRDGCGRCRRWGSERRGGWSWRCSWACAFP